MSEPVWDELLGSMHAAVEERRFEEALILADRWIANNGPGDSRALYLRARALTGLERDDEATRAWEQLIALPAQNEPEQVAAADGLYFLAESQLTHQHNVTRALEASETVTNLLERVTRRDLVRRLAERGDRLVTIVVGARFYPEGDALSRQLIAAHLGDDGEQGVLIDLNARLMGMIAAVNLGEPEDLERSVALFENVASGGELALVVLDRWMRMLEGAESPHAGLVASMANLKAVTLAKCGQHHAARDLLRSTKGRFASDPDPLVQATLGASDQILADIASGQLNDTA